MHAVGVREVRRHADQKSVDDTEHRDGRANSEPQCEHHGAREQRPRAKAPNRVAKVLSENVQPRHAVYVAAFILDPIHPAERETGLTHRFVARDPSGLELSRLLLEMKAQLVVEIPLHRLPAKQRSEPVAEVAPRIAQPVA